MTTAEAIEKIKKLLRMKRGGTDAEIATALRRAMQLAEKHGIDIATVNPDEDNEARRVGHVAQPCGVRVKYDHKYASRILQRYFNVETIFGGRYAGVCKYERVINLVGTPLEREIARYVFIFICGQFNFAWRTRRGRCRNRRNFIFGMYLGICANLKTPESETVTCGSAKEALIVSRQAYLEKTWPLTKSMANPKPKRVSHAAWVGYQAGKNTHIRPAIERSETAGPLRLCGATHG